MRRLLIALLLLASCSHTATRPDPAAVTRVADCPQGEARGCAILANEFAEGQGRPRDLERAATLHLFACDHGWAESCTMAASFTREGTGGIDKDPAEAMRLLERGCSGEDGLGCLLLGDLFAHGDGVAPDPTRAQELYRRGCELKEAAACRQSGDALRESDRDRALTLFQAGCELGDGASCGKAGYQLAQAPDAAMKLREASTLFERGCELDDPLSCFNAAMLKAETEPAAAVDLLRRVCVKGSADACAAGARVAKGAKDWDSAIELGTRGCALENADACAMKKLAEANAAYEAKLQALEAEERADGGTAAPGQSAQPAGE